MKIRLDYLPNDFDISQLGNEATLFDACLYDDWLRYLYRIDVDSEILEATENLFAAFCEWNSWVHDEFDRDHNFQDMDDDEIERVFIRTLSSDCYSGHTMRKAIAMVGEYIPMGNIYKKIYGDELVWGYPGELREKRLESFELEYLISCGRCYPGRSQEFHGRRYIYDEESGHIYDVKDGNIIAQTYPADDSDMELITAEWQ